MVVEEGKIAEFARAVKSTSAAHRGPDAVSPPTFLMAAAHWMGPQHAALQVEGADYSRVLHGAQEFVFHGEPPRAGTVLHGVERIDRVYEKQGRRGGVMQFTDIVTAYTDADGRVVAEVRSTVIQTERAPAEETTA